MGTELSFFGISDYREPCVLVQNPEGDRLTELLYCGYEILDEKPRISGMPSMRGKETLVLHLFDEVKGFGADLYYTVYDDCDVIARRIVYKNCSENTVSLLRAYSFSMTLPENDYDAPGFLAEMQRVGCRFASLEDRQKLAQCYKAVFDTVPKAIHLGHSDLELLTDPHVEKPLKRYYLWFCPPKEDDGFHLDSPRLAEVLPSTGVTEHQRFLERCLQSQTLPTRLFDPCPCGSGLYYTDCCGKR